MCGISGIMSSRFNHKMDRLKSEIQGMTNQLKEGDLITLVLVF